MGTRSGDLDATIPLYLAENCGVPMKQMERLLNKQSGLLGIAGSSDMRTIAQEASKGSEAASLALDVSAAIAEFSLTKAA